MLFWPFLMRPASTAHRYSVESSDSELRITIQPRRRTWVAVLNGLACAVWAAFLVFVLMHDFTLAGTNLIFLGVGLLMLLVGLLFTAYQMAWELAGIETISVMRDALLVNTGTGSFVRTRRYALAGTRNFRIPLEHGSWWAEIEASPRQGPRGMIHFDYHGRRRRFGGGLSVPEAQAILELIEPRLTRR